MSIKTKDIIPGTVVITSMPFRKLQGDSRLSVLAENGSFFDVSDRRLPVGTPLTIRSKPLKLNGASSKMVGVETFGGQKLVVFLTNFKPRVTIADHD